MKTYGGNLNVYYWVKEAKLKRLHTDDYECMTF